LTIQRAAVKHFAMLRALQRLWPRPKNRNFPASRPSWFRTWLSRESIL